MTTTPQVIGAAGQTLIDPTIVNLPSSIPPNGAVQSSLIFATGWTKIAAGLTLSQAGNVTLQRYIDGNGAVPSGPPLTLALLPGVASALVADDGQFFSSFQLTVQNNANTTAILTNLAVAVASDQASAVAATTGSYATATSLAVTVPVTAGGAVLLSANPNAAYRCLRNPLTGGKPVWVSFGANPGASSGLFDLQPGDTYEMTAAQGNLFQGPITAIADNTNNDGNSQLILVTEGV